MTVDTSTYVPDFLIIIEGEPFRPSLSLNPAFGGMLDVLAVSITESTDQSDQFSFRVRGRLPELERFPSGENLLWVDDDLFRERNTVDIKMGYVGNRSLEFSGEITAISASFAASGLITLSVQGQGLYHRLHRGRQIEPFERTTDSHIVQQIAEQCRLEYKLDDTAIEHPTVSYEGMTFHAILQDRARRLGYEVAVKENTLFFQKPRYKVSQRADLDLTWGVDLISFNARIATNNMPTAYSARGTVTGHGGAKEAVGATVTAEDTPAFLANESGAQRASRFGQSHRLVRDHRVANAEDA